MADYCEKHHFDPEDGFGCPLCDRDEIQILRARVAELETQILAMEADANGLHNPGDLELIHGLEYTVDETHAERHQRVWTGPGELERTGYLDPGTTPYPETDQA